MSAAIRFLHAFAALLAFALLAIDPLHAAVSIKTALDRDTIGAGESATLTISIEGGNPERAENFPPIKGLTIQYQGISQNVSIVNGVSSSKRILSFGVSASQPGIYTIPAINVVVDGTPYPTQPVKLTVAKGDASSAQNRYAFLRLTVPKKEIYVGEVIPVEMQLFITQAENVNAPQLKSDGFIIHKQPEHTQAQTQIGNIIYRVLEFKLSVSAAKAGDLTLGPAESSLVLLLRAQQDPNDFFGFFNRYQRRQITVSSPAIPIKVLPLPSTNVPPEFNGAIGSFNWNVTAAPLSVTAGDPITLKINVSGRGNFDTLKLPELKWPDFNIYQPNSTVTSDDPLGIEGRKNFEQVIVPQTSGVHEIPAFSLACFDPEKKRYIELKQPAIPIKVTAGTASAAQPVVLAPKGSQPEPPQERTDIVHIKMSPGPIVAVGEPLIRQPWFLLLEAIPVLAFAGVTFWRKREDQLANNPRLRRKIAVQKTVSSGLTELHQLAAANRSDDFYALMFRLLQEELGERLDLPASAITEAVLDDQLPARGAASDTIDRLRRLFQICNQARYAPARGNQELLALASDCSGAISELQRLPDQ